MWDDVEHGQPMCPDLWPLKVGDTLTDHDWHPFHTHKFLSEPFVRRACMEGRRADIGTWMILWTEAIRQNPAGTLPKDDVELADLARFRSVGDWQAVRAQVLTGWKEVLVEDDRLGITVQRLGHPDSRELVEDMHRRKLKRALAIDTRNFAVKKARVKKKMIELGYEPHIPNDDRVLYEMAVFFVEQDMQITNDNVRAVFAELYGYDGKVTPLIGRHAGVKSN